MKTKYLLSVLLVLLVALSYMGNYRASEKELYERANLLFLQESAGWGDSLMHIRKIPISGKYNSEEYRKKKKHTVLMLEDTIVISTRFWHPKYSQYQRDTRTAFHLLGTIYDRKDRYDLSIVDTLFQRALVRKGIEAEVAIALGVRDLGKIFPSEDSMCVDAPIEYREVSRELTGCVPLDTVNIGICNQGELSACISISPAVVLEHMNLFGWWQMLAMVLALAGWLLVIGWKRFRSLANHLIMLGNTCIDLDRGKAWLWNGECRAIPGNQLALLKMLAKTAPLYRLKKEDICRTLWGRDAKDGQALYNTTVSGLRKLFVADDEALELKTYAKEGVELVVNQSSLKKGRAWHFYSKLIWKK